MVVCVIVWAPPGIPGKDGLGGGAGEPLLTVLFPRVQGGRREQRQRTRLSWPPRSTLLKLGHRLVFVKVVLKKKPQPRAPPSPEQGERRRQLWALRSEACGLLAWRHLPGGRQHPEGSQEGSWAPHVTLGGHRGTGGASRWLSPRLPPSLPGGSRLQGPCATSALWIPKI